MSRKSKETKNRPAAVGRQVPDQGLHHTNPQFIKPSLRSDYPLTPQDTASQPIRFLGVRWTVHDQSGTVPVYVQNWRETSKRIQPMTPE